MAKVPGKHCRNRDIINVGNRLHSPDYDFEGDSGPAWYEWDPWHEHEPASMCGYGVCMGGDVDAWKDAMNNYYEKTFKPLLRHAKSLAIAQTEGGPSPFRVEAVINTAEKVEENWKALRTTDAPWAFNVPAINNYVYSIVRQFDSMACDGVDPLNELLEEFGAVHLTQKASARKPKAPPGGGSWLRNGAPEPEKPGGIGVVGWLAIGAAGYFGFKALTE